MNEAEQLIERQIRRDIQYRLILRLILRQNTVHLFTSRQPADGHPEGSERPWRTSMEPENVHVKWAHGPRPKQTWVVRSGPWEDTRSNPALRSWPDGWASKVRFCRTLSRSPIGSGKCLIRWNRIQSIP